MPKIHKASGMIAASIALLLASTVSASNWTSDVIKLEPKRGEVHSPVITALAIHPAGDRIALGGDDHLVRIWDLREKRVIRVLEGHTDWVRTLSYSPRGDMLVTSGHDRQVFVWDTVTGEKLREYSQLSHVVTSVVFSHDSKLVAVVGFGDKVRIIDGTTGDRLREYGCPCIDMRTIAFSPDDSIIVGGGRNGKIRLWNSADGKVLGEFTAHSQRIRDLAFRSDGSALATCGEDRKVVITSTTGEQLVELPRQGAKVMALVFCGSDELATGGSDNAIRIWNLATRKEVETLTGHTGTIAVLAYLNNVLVSSSFDATVRVWTRQNVVADSGETLSPRVGLRREDIESHFKVR